MIEESHDNLHRALAERDFAHRAAEEKKAELVRLCEQFWQLKKELLYYQNPCEIYEMKLADRSSGNDEDAQSARRYRRTRRTEMGDYQMTIEETLSSAQEGCESIDENMRTTVLENTDDDG